MNNNDLIYLFKCLPSSRTTEANICQVVGCSNFPEKGKITVFTSKKEEPSYNRFRKINNKYRKKWNPGPVLNICIEYFTSNDF